MPTDSNIETTEEAYRSKLAELRAAEAALRVAAVPYDAAGREVVRLREELRVITKD